jgi:hypothetical protein
LRQQQRATLDALERFVVRILAGNTLGDAGSVIRNEFQPVAFKGP